MKLISVNVAEPKVVIAGDQQIATAIFKKPVEGPVRVTALNLEGDRQADLRVHGGPDKAVYAYSWQNILYWRRELRRGDLGPGTFGENLTVDGLADGEIGIGDILEIGTARLQVTQPRIPCFKLGIALGLPDFPKRFHRAGRNGFYLRVLREGLLAAGDSIRLIPAEDANRMTIAEFVRLVRSGVPGAEDLARIMRLDALPQSWKDHLTEKAAAQPASRPGG
jgi:MOSC domain-containing protein YiiM